MSRLAAVALIVCLLLAGCGGPSDESATTDAETTADATRAIAAPISETTGESGETTTGTETNRTTHETAATYNQNMPYEVRVSNAGETPRNLTVRISAANDSTSAFEATVRLSANESREFNFTVSHVGEYEARVEMDGEITTQRWDVASRDPKRALSVHVSVDGEVYVGFVDI